jgi:DNA modification methylase
MIEPRYRDSGVTIYLGEVRAVLAELEAESVDAIVTSPPYFNLRDYGLPPAAWGGDPDHAHVWGADVVLDRRGHSKGKAASDDARQASNGSFCECGSWCGQLGLEPDPLLYVDHLVEVFRAAWRVLRRDGTLWLNIGDSYASKARGSDLGWDRSRLTNPGYSQKAQAASLRVTGERHRGKGAGFKAKDRMLIPARVAIALQDDGWWLRDEIIWAKDNPMPSSVDDRTTPAHEMVYTLTKSGAPLFWTHRDGRRVDRRPPPDYVWLDQADDDETADEPPDWRTELMEDGERRWRRVNLWRGHDYYYDSPAIRETFVSSPSDLRKMVEGRERIGGRVLRLDDKRNAASGLTRVGRKRSVGDPAAAAAELARRTKRPAGWNDGPTGDDLVGRYSDGRVPRGWANGPGRGHDPLIGRYQPRPRRTDKQAATAGARASGGDRWSGLNDRWDAGEATGTNPGGRNKRSVWTVSTQPYAGAHYATFPTALIEPMILAGVPGGGVVLDPFAGSGTVGLVAKQLGRRAVLIDLGEEYVEQAIRRTSHEFGVGGRDLADDGTAEPEADGIWAVAE